MPMATAARWPREMGRGGPRLRPAAASAVKRRKRKTYARPVESAAELPRACSTASHGDALYVLVCAVFMRWLLLVQGLGPPPPFLWASCRRWHRPFEKSGLSHSSYFFALINTAFSGRVRTLSPP